MTVNHKKTELENNPEIRQSSIEKKKLEPSTSYREKSDSELILLAQEGDQKAFEELIKRYQRQLYNFIYRMLGNTEEAKELFQETFLRIYKNLRQFRKDAKFAPWAYRIAHNLCIDQLRRAEKDVLKNKVEPFDREKRPRDPIEHRGDEKLQTPEQIAYKKQLSQYVQKAVEKLPPKQRAVFILYQYNNFSYDEIAEYLNIPLGTVKSRMHNALKRLESSLKPLIQQKSKKNK